MLATFVLDNKNRDAVLVNPDQVTCVRAMSEGTKIEFDKDYYVIVTADLATTQEQPANPR
jgi:hypothetical protein